MRLGIKECPEWVKWQMAELTRGSGRKEWPGRAGSGLESKIARWLRGNGIGLVSEYIAIWVSKSTDGRVHEYSK